MHLARHAISSTTPVEVLDAHFDASASIFTVATPSGFAVYRTWPLQLLRVREFTGGSLAIVLPMHTSSLLFLVGGGASPLYPPNKIVVWDDARARAVAELEFRERVRGLAVRRGWLIVALRRRVVAFEIGEEIRRVHEWDTCDNQRGLVAIATAAHATLLAIAGRQTGHVQLIHLPPCRPPAPTPNTPASPPRPPPKPVKHPASIIVAHSTALSTLTVLPSGRLLATTSSQGTLLRIWDAHTGKLVRELRRGSDKAEIYGVAFRPDEQEVCCWSDKGTVHVFSLATGSSSLNRQSAFSPLTPFISLPRYFDSEWSYAQYRIPSQKTHIALSAGTSSGRLADVQDERCTVAWVQVPPPESTLPSTITTPAPRKGEDKGKGRQPEAAPPPPPEYQMIALTYSGGWYRIALPSSPSANTSATGAGSATIARTPSLSGAGVSHMPSHRERRSSGGSSIVTGRNAATARTAKGKGKEREGDEKDKEKAGRECTLQEFRRFGRWDGWG
ncbi:WD40 repeat-like protein [Fomitiporia mediterranea MF3/22]|uniref:WD40 repeat-like protein n=1 Tax=Fomitiporia mediterranea (strain MF3/22) TaxID=694068 RepID=UPI0004408E70|nr:WD40 repeat-like protein [Fomitiporia mediterranea MF3/22]EJD01438.1 WD40 repeat-like protein [Fomitiporia mediterranea MF3/22]